MKPNILNVHRFLMVWLVGLVGPIGVMGSVDWQARGDAAADYSAMHGGRAMLVMHQGRTVFERYDNGWTPDRPHALASGTKSFVGVLAMAAIEDGIIPSLDAVVADDIPQWRDDPLKSQITVRHLLELSSGLSAVDPRVETRGGSRVLGDVAARRAQRIERTGIPEADDKHAAALDARMTGRPGAQFAYGATHFYAFGAYLEARLAKHPTPHKTVETYFRARISEPIAMTIGRWGRDRSGNVNTPGGMMLTAREWAKFGELVRGGGSYPDRDGVPRQVIATQLLHECFQPSQVNANYGLTWWLPAQPRGQRRSNRMLDEAVPDLTRLTNPDGSPLTLWMAAGLGKQRLLVLPEHDLVVVRFAAANLDGRQFDDEQFLRLLLDQPPQ